MIGLFSVSLVPSRTLNCSEHDGQIRPPPRAIMVQDNLLIINNSALRRALPILLKFGTLMQLQCGSLEAAQWTTSTSCQIQDGGQRPN